MVAQDDRYVPGDVNTPPEVWRGTQPAWPHTGLQKGNQIRFYPWSKERQKRPRFRSAHISAHSPCDFGLFISSF